MTRLAVAIHPPPGIAAVLARLPRPPLPGVNWASPDQWMVKLRPLGHVPVHLVGPLIEALTAELAAAGPATCVLGPVTRRLGGQWLGVPVSGLADLVAVVFDATVGIVPVTHPQPHDTDVVVARGRVPAALAGGSVEGRWVAEKAALVADRSAPGRPRFEDLAEFRLGPA